MANRAKLPETGSTICLPLHELRTMRGIRSRRPVSARIPYELDAVRQLIPV